ncbi:MAG: aminotransferase class I/II-fold pyridoxal phosphate-dependent enzyme [Bacteroidia bacterium]|nr:aminotransferase class I/II-fold pyridoxal phosphate-dependent enzyme [Bacteroidia bacterium]
MMNAGLGVYEMGSPLIALEKIVVQEVARALGYPASADGMLTSGGSLGNLTALLAARQTRAGYDIWQEGSLQTAPLAVMVSEESHYCVERAIRILGWGDKGLIKVPVDAAFRMRADQLEAKFQEARDQGIRVLAVVANACSTATGSYDPIAEMADFCEKYNLWLHVDGAHGAAVAFSSQYRPLVTGIERADSVVLDFHKMLLTPALSTALIFKQGNLSYQTFAQQASYLWADDQQAEWYNLGKRTFECTKVAMGLRTYVLLKAYGPALWEQYIDRCYDLGQVFAQILRESPDFTLLLNPMANIVCFRYTPQGWQDSGLSALNHQIRQHLLESGDFYIVQTQIQGAIYLRVTLLNPFTKTEDLLALLTKIRTIHQKYHS